MLLVVGTAAGEWGRVSPASFSLRSLLALGYLVAFGSLIAFTAYIWLLRNTTPSRVATYAYVNPLVAVLLGWALAGEQVGWRIALAAGIIVGSVMLTIGAGAEKSDTIESDAGPDGEPERRTG
jgi:drug/metabolite transporter (DMT)-like permease